METLKETIKNNNHLLSEEYKKIVGGVKGEIKSALNEQVIYVSELH
jgi:hypothetical protein